MALEKKEREEKEAAELAAQLDEEEEVPETEAEL